MPQTAAEITQELDRARARLTADVENLERRVKSAVSWRGYVEARPLLTMSGVFLGGVAIALAVHKASTHYFSNERSHGRLRGMADETARHWDDIATALVAVGADKLKSLLGELIPGFAASLAVARGKLIDEGRG